MKELKLTNKIDKIEYHYRYEIGKEDHRQATVYFQDGKYQSCKFFGCSHEYTLDDWQFIGKLAAEIFSLQNKNNDR